jgi:hypothetical protein
MDLIPEHSDLSRRGNAQSDLVALHADHGHYHIIADGETFAGSATQYQHAIPLSKKSKRLGMFVQRFIGKA